MGYIIPCEHFKYELFISKVEKKVLASVVDEIKQAIRSRRGDSINFKITILAKTSDK